MTTFESLSQIIGNLSSQERKTVRRYIASFIALNKNSRSLKLFDLICYHQGKTLTEEQLQRRLYGKRHPKASARLISQLHKRVLEALSLPIISGKGKFADRIWAEIHLHRQYIKALVLFEAGDHAASNATLLALFYHTSEFELYAERISAVEFLMHTIRVYSTPEAIQHFRDVPAQSRFHLALQSSGEALRELANANEMQRVEHEYAKLKQYAKQTKSPRAMFLLRGVEAKIAEQRGHFKRAEKFYYEQLGYCNNPSVYTEENKAQVQIDIAWIHFRQNKIALAKQFLRELTYRKRKTKATLEQIEKLEKELP
jgi:hypothetical protein